MSCYEQSIQVEASENLHPYMRNFLLVLYLTEVFSMYVDYRQLECYKAKQMHPYLKSSIDAKEFADSQVYNHEKHGFSIIRGFF